MMNVINQNQFLDNTLLDKYLAMEERHSDMINLVSKLRERDFLGIKRYYSRMKLLDVKLYYETKFPVNNTTDEIKVLNDIKILKGRDNADNWGNMWAQQETKRMISTKEAELVRLESIKSLNKIKLLDHITTTSSIISDVELLLSYEEEKGSKLNQILLNIKNKLVTISDTEQQIIQYIQSLNINSQVL